MFLSLKSDLKALSTARKYNPIRNIIFENFSDGSNFVKSSPFSMEIKIFNRRHWCISNVKMRLKITKEFIFIFKKKTINRQNFRIF